MGESSINMVFFRHGQILDTWPGLREKSSRRIERLVLLMLGSNGTNVLMMSDLVIDGICIVG